MEESERKCDRREEFREYMNGIYDLERLTMKSTVTAQPNPRDLIAFKTSVTIFPLHQRYPRAVSVGERWCWR